MRSSHPASWAPRTAVIITVLVLVNAVTPMALAQKTHYTDVPEGAFYEDAAEALLEIHALDANEPRFRPSALATRAEMAKLLINLRDIPLREPVVGSFNDVPRDTWYFSYMEAAADAGWFHGDRDCYQQFRPCTVRPANPLNRAEAAAILARAFALDYTGTAPDFPDNDSDEWYYTNIQAAADHCVLQGDERTTMVRPASFMNRAEMIAMFHRASQNLDYGVDCGTAVQHSYILDVSALSTTSLRMTFKTDIASTHVEDESRYTVVEDADGSDVRVVRATRVDSRTVDLELDDNIVANTPYTVTASNLLSLSGNFFTDNARFIFRGEASHITNITAVSSTRVHVSFDTDIDSPRAQDELRYAVIRLDNGSAISVRSATMLNARTVELDLRSGLTPAMTYLVSVRNMLTSNDVIFSDSATVVHTAVTTGHITDVSVTTSPRIRVTFDVDLDRFRAEEAIRYTVSDGNREIPISSVRIMTSNSVQITLSESLRLQHAYTVTAHDMLTPSGVLFSDSAALIYNASAVGFSTNLAGSREFPPVITTAYGTGSFVLGSDGLRYDVTAQNFSGPITAAHFHMAATGENGPVVFTIPFTGNHATGQWSNITTEQRNTLLDGRIYVNVHTAAHPDGEIRGQLQLQ